MLTRCTSSTEDHSIIVSRWAKNNYSETAEQYICQHCFRFFDAQRLVERHTVLSNQERQDLGEEEPETTPSAPPDLR